MSNSARWRKFLEWWREISPKGHLYPPEVLTNMINAKIAEIKKVVK